MSEFGGTMATSLVRSRATITGVKDRFTWNEIKDGAVTTVGTMSTADVNAIKAKIGK